MRKLFKEIKLLDCFKLLAAYVFFPRVYALQKEYKNFIKLLLSIN